MSTHYIALAIPFFFLLIGIELLWAWRTGARVYRFGDAVTDIGCGISQRMVMVVFQGGIIAVYAWVWENHRLVDFAPGSWWPWLIGIIGYDFIYYWWHRWSHEVNFLWAVHVVHHQSEDYNLAVALRQAMFSSVTALPLDILLALLGVHPAAFILANAVSLIYQFWIHTELVDKLPRPVELAMNTPSHHRVHHGVNEQYLDRNYAGILIVWDRMFGSFELERERPIFGVVKPLRSYNALWANFQHWVTLGRMALRTRRWVDKLRLFVAPPAWTPPDHQGPVPQPPRTAAERPKYDPRPTRGVIAWVLMNFGLVSAGVMLCLLYQEQMTWPQRTAIVALILMTVAGWGALFERKRWALPVEVGRLGLAAAWGLAYAIA